MEEEGFEVGLGVECHRWVRMIWRGVEQEVVGELVVGLYPRCGRHVHISIKLTRSLKHKDQARGGLLLVEA